MELQACLNGARSSKEHPAVPTTADQTRDAAARCMSQGVSSIHIHPRDGSGAESLDHQVMNEWLSKLRTSCEGLPIGVSTGEWIAPLRKRLAYIEQWQEKPDFASVNFHENGAEKIADALLKSGVGVEAGIWSQRGAECFMAFGRRSDCLRTMIELPNQPWMECQNTIYQVLSILNDDPYLPTYLLHGKDASVWPAIIEATKRGWDTRIGLEDTLRLPDESAASGNSDLVNAARTIIRGNKPEVDYLKKLPPLTS